jgi:2-polyprenyl-3-methyl-5-hydroxy-6-metoxy-1,4-benzoquinol methylase
MDPRLTRHALGFWELASKPSLQELHDYYARTYYQESRASYEAAYSAAELRYFRAKLEQRRAVIQRYRSVERGTRMLDVGCGEGYALAYFREMGWSVRGLDFSAAGVASKNPHCQDSLITGDLFELLRAEMSSGRSYDVVWLQNVLEHVLEPVELLRSLLALVPADGVAVVTVPNDCSITQRAALESGHIDRAFWVAPPDHLSYFDRESLANTAAATGWECRDIIADFPIDWLLFHPASNYVRDSGAGKAAHQARVELENLIHTRPMQDVNEFWSSLARLGFGRNLTAFLTPRDNAGSAGA